MEHRTERQYYLEKWGMWLQRESSNISKELETYRDPEDFLEALQLSETRTKEILLAEF